jgi:hypothetical protein
LSGCINDVVATAHEEPASPCGAGFTNGFGGFAMADVFKVGIPAVG